jgi:hypothetical protein
MPEEIRQELARRFEPSRIEIRDPSREGTVTRRGRILTLAAAAVPAKPFRVVEVGRTHPVRQHVMDFARVKVAPDGRVETDPGPLTVPRGTRMVILELRFGEDEVRMLTHTAEPLDVRSHGDVVYGCTEFVFRFTAATMSAGAIEPIMSVIEGWLEGTIADRTCREGLTQLCIEP